MVRTINQSGSCEGVQRRGAWMGVQRGVWRVVYRQAQRRAWKEAWRGKQGSVWRGVWRVAWRVTKRVAWRAVPRVAQRGVHYHWLALATIDYWVITGKLKFETYFKVVYPFLCRKWSQNVKGDNDETVVWVECRGVDRWM